MVKQKQNYLEVPDQILMNYHYSYGGQSKFFLGLMEKKIFATKCKKCGIVRMPPRIYCSCCYTDMQWIEVSDRGTIIAATTAWFAASTFTGKIPYTMAYIKLEGCNTYICQNIVKKGLVTPGCIRGKDKVKAVFRNKREGKPTDFFFVLENELDPKLVKKKGLTENEIKWLKQEYKKSEREKVKGGKSEREKTTNIKEITNALKKTFSLLNKSPRAKEVIKNWAFNLEIKVVGIKNKIFVQIKNQKVSLVKNLKNLHLQIETENKALLKNTKGEVDITQYEAKGKVKIIKGELIDLIRYNRAIMATFKDLKEKKIW